MFGGFQVGMCQSQTDVCCIGTIIEHVR
jgi:hypothetical protein